MQTLHCQIRKDSGPEKKAPESFFPWQIQQQKKRRHILREKKIYLYSGGSHRILQPFRMRVTGFEKYMEKEPGITIEMVRSGYSNMRVSQKDVDEILVKYPDLNGIMTTSAVTALGLSEATEGREISIVSVDAQEDALKAVQDGRIVALGAQSGYQIGYETIRYIVKDLEGEGTGEDEILDSQVLTEENIDTYMKAAIQK